jgi:hypothetical protein
MEQISRGLCDAMLETSSGDSYRLFVASEGIIHEIVLAALYTVRSRTLWLPVFGGQRSIVTPLISPVIDMFNHAAKGSANCIASVNLQHNTVVVEATRTIRRGEEMTLRYAVNPSLPPDEVAADFECRYQLPLSQ